MLYKCSIMPSVTYKSADACVLQLRWNRSPLHKRHKYNLVYRTLNVSCLNSLRENLFACSAAQGCKFKDCCEVVTSDGEWACVCVCAGKDHNMSGLVQMFLSDLGDKVLFFSFRQQI